MKRLLLLLFVVPTLAVAASGVAASSTAVSITSTGFHPSSVTVAAGDNVTWTNNDALRHQVVANNGSFSSPVLSAKQSYSHTFRTGGTFGYHDGLHPALRARVAVVPPRTVWIMGDGFLPSTIVIRTGQAVTWVNRTSANQQVIADDASFTSSVLARGGVFSHTFASACFAHAPVATERRRGRARSAAPSCRGLCCPPRRAPAARVGERERELRL